MQRLQFWGLLGACVALLAGCGQSGRDHASVFVTRAEPLSYWSDDRQELLLQSGAFLQNEADLPSSPAPVISISGDTALFPKPYFVSTFRLVGSAWVHQGDSNYDLACDELNGPAISRGFAAISGEVALLSANTAPGHFGPCVYQRSGQGWAYLQALESSSNDESLSGSFAISGDTAMTRSSRGVAVFERESGAFRQTQSLVTSDGASGPKPFALSGNMAVVLSGGSAYVFSRGAAGWAQIQVLAAVDGQAFLDVVLAGERLLLRTDSVYAYAWVGSTMEWVLDGKLSGGLGDGRFMDVLGDVALVGAAAYERSGGAWRKVQDFALNPARTDPLSPSAQRPLTETALWAGGALFALSGTASLDGTTVHIGGRVYSFQRVTEPAHCGSDEECASGHCVEGVCCKTACSGTCESCLAARKGDGIDGVCGFVAANSDPRDSCGGAGGAGPGAGAGTTSVDGGAAGAIGVGGATNGGVADGGTAGETPGGGDSCDVAGASSAGRGGVDGGSAGATGSGGAPVTSGGTAATAGNTAGGHEGNASGRASWGCRMTSRGAGEPWPLGLCLILGLHRLGSRRVRRLRSFGTGA
jgi:hypothetical protein